MNSKDKLCNYALSHAMFKCKSFETVALLLDNGANSYLKNRYGATVFDENPVFFKHKSDMEKMRQLLTERSALSQ